MTPSPPSRPRRQRRRRLAAVGAAFPLAAMLLLPFAAEAATLRVRVEGFRNLEGTVEFGVWDKPEAFPEYEGRLAGAFAKVSEDGVVGVFEGLPPGKYAVAVFHDENDNGEFDRGFLGLPLEGYGFSNDAQVFLGPPSFEAAAVAVDAEDRTISITIVY